MTTYHPLAVKVTKKSKILLFELATVTNEPLYLHELK